MASFQEFVKKKYSLDNEEQTSNASNNKATTKPKNTFENFVSNKYNLAPKTVPVKLSNEVTGKRNINLSTDLNKINIPTQIISSETAPVKISSAFNNSKREINLSSNLNKINSTSNNNYNKIDEINKNIADRQRLKRAIENDIDASNYEQYNIALSTDKLDKEIFDLENEKSQLIKYDDTFLGQTQANYTLGRLSQDEGNAWFDYMLNPTEENRQKAQSISDTKNIFINNNIQALDDENEVLPIISKSFAGYIPQLIDSGKSQAVSAAVGGLLGSMAGPAGTVGGIKLGINAGRVIGSGTSSYRVMSGTAFKTLIDMGVDEKTALSAANDEAVISSLIEMGGTLISMGLTGTGKLADVLTNSASSKAINSATSAVSNKLSQALAKHGITGTKEAILKASIGYLGNIASEAGEEASQELVSIANERRLSNDELGVSNLLRNIGSTATSLTDEDRARIIESAKGGASIAAIMGGLETLGSNILLNRSPSDTQQNMTMPSDTQYFKGVTNIEELNNLRLNLIKKYHTDNIAYTGDTNKINEYNNRMAAINTEYDSLVRTLDMLNSTQFEEQRQSLIQRAKSILSTWKEKFQNKKTDTDREAIAYIEETIKNLDNINTGMPININTNILVNETPFANMDTLTDVSVTTNSLPDDTDTKTEYGLEDTYNSSVNDTAIADTANANVPNLSNEEKIEAIEKTIENKVQQLDKIESIDEQAKAIEEIKLLGQELVKEKSEVEAAVNGHTLQNNETNAIVKPSYYDEIATALQSNNTIVKDKLSFSIEENPDTGKFKGYIRTKDSALLNLNKKDKLYETMEYNTREGAVSELVNTSMLLNLEPTTTNNVKEENNEQRNSEEISDGQGIPSTDIRGESESGVLDRIPSENVPSNEETGDIVSDIERGRGGIDRPSDRPDASGAGGRRSLGSSEGQDIQRVPSGRIGHILKYKSSESYKINEKLNHSLELTKEDRNFIENLDRELESVPIYKGKVYRNITFDTQGEEAYNSFINEHRIGFPVRYNGYTSSSKILDGYPVDGDLVVHLEIESINGRDISKGYGNEDEQEVLFESGLTIIPTEITTASDGKILIKAKEVEIDVIERPNALNTGERGGTVRVMQELQRGDSANMQSVSQRDTGHDIYGQTRPQRAISGGQRDTLRPDRPGTSGESSIRGNAVKPILNQTDIPTEITDLESDKASKRGRLGRLSKSGDKKQSVIPSGGTEQTQDEIAKTETTAKPVPKNPKTIKEIAEVKTQQVLNENPKGKNFVIGDSLDLPNGEKARYKANIDAIKLVKQLMAENRYATDAEQVVLSKYVGWGGLSNAFNSNNKNWSNEYAELKELLSPEEWNTARNSTLNAHYTDISVIRAMYAGLNQLGFKGGNLLEPSAGIGNFLGAMPANMLNGVKSWTCVELDSITGNILKYLYPNANVKIQGFETANIPDNYMDVAISNVPFGNYAVVDKKYPNYITSAIHNYFFAKSLDKVHNGGIVMFITSRYTMDSKDSRVREYIAKKADLLGAIRLPDSAFKSNAGTSVVTDILVLKKRAEGTPYSGESFIESGYVNENIKSYYTINNYFKEHPEMILGTATVEHGMYSANSLTYKANEGVLSEQIEEAFKNIKGTIDYPDRKTDLEIVKEQVKRSRESKPSQLTARNGKVYSNDNGELKEVEYTDKKSQDIALKAISIRDTARELLNAQLEGKPNKEINKLREQLNNIYDEYVKENGIINGAKTKKVIGTDKDYPFICALEIYDKDTNAATKADIFFKNTVSKIERPTHAADLNEAITISINESAEINVDRISELLSQPTEKITRQLIDTRMAFKTRNGTLEPANVYLSGNVRAKLAEAEMLMELDSDYKNNVEELKKIIPKDRQPEDITVKIGANWVPEQVYEEFIAEILNTYKGAVEISYNKITDEWSLSLKNKYIKNGVANRQKWGTPERSFLEILNRTLNNKKLTVTYEVDGKRFINKDATEAAIVKQKEIQDEFSTWLWKDENRKKELLKLYNDIFNCLVTPKYDGSNLTVAGSNVEKPLRPHQKDAVQRIISSGGNTLLAHMTGAGKTYTMAAAAMKLKQLGIVKKPMFVVPKSVLAQWGSEFYDFFPAANILITSETDFAPKNRAKYINKIATGDYDAVIISYEQFEEIQMSNEYQKQFYQRQLDEVILAENEERAKNGKNSLTVKQYAKKIKTLENKIAQLSDVNRQDTTPFEELGVDSLFVDEAHNFKNLMYTTKMNNISGLGNKDGSKRAFDMFMKTQYLQQLNGGRGLVFATATPIMNSVAEMYTMQRYLQNNLLNQKGLISFDAWANAFGDIKTVQEINPSGTGFRNKEVLAKYKNTQDLMQMFTAFTDVVRNIETIKLPKMETGKFIVVECEPSDEQLDYMNDLVKRAEDIKSGKVDPKEDNMLKLNTDGKKVTYTRKAIDNNLSYEPEGKIAQAARNIKKIYDRTKDIKGTQIVFSDMFTPVKDNGETLNIYDGIKGMLVDLGIPEEEIKYAHDAKNDVQRKALYKQVNEGKVRVIIGSTSKLGVGVNIQKRAVAMHLLDAPARPGDVEQRVGRIIRQGNINEQVGVYQYITKKTFDARLWDNLERKSGFINQILSGDYTGNESGGDGDFQLTAAEIKSIATGDPLIQEQFKVQQDISRLESLQKSHLKSVRLAKENLYNTEKTIRLIESNLKNREDDVKRIEDLSGDNFKIKVRNKVFNERTKGGEALYVEIRKLIKSMPDKTIKVGEISSFDINVDIAGNVFLQGSLAYPVKESSSAKSLIQNLENTVKKIRTDLATAKERLKSEKASIPELKKIAESNFAQENELKALRKRNEEIYSILNPDVGEEIVDNHIDGYINNSGIENYSPSNETNSLSKKQEISPKPENWTAQRIGDTDKTPMRLTDIVEKIRHDFGINITTGHIRGKGVRGQFNRQNQGIRSRIINDLPTISHELGHFLDNKYSITGTSLTKELRAELKNNLDEDMKSVYSKNKWEKEGLAEYIRKFLQNRETTSIDYPEFTKYFLNSVDGKDAALITQLADEINAYYSLDADTATSSIRLREEKPINFETIEERIKNKYNALYQAWVDSNNGIKLYDEATGANSYILASNAAYSDAIAAQIIVGDLTDNNGRYVSPGLGTVLHGINLNNKEEYRLFGEYLVVKHGPERLAEGKRVFADDRKNSTIFMEKRREELEAQYPEFKGASERLYEFEYNLINTWGVDTGLISQDTVEKWHDRWKYYVPFNRDVGKRASIGAKRGFANQNSTIKKAYGSGRDIIHPVDGIMQNIIKLVNAGTRNNVMRAITDHAETMGANALFLEKIPTPIKASKINIAGVKQNISDKITESSMNAESQVIADEIVQGIDDIIIQYGRGKAYGDVITVMKNGLPEFWKINDPLLLQSLTSMSPKAMEGILDAYAMISRFMTANITGNNAVWSLFSNFPRDFMTLLTYSSTKNPITLINGMGITYINKINEQLGKEVDPLYKEYLAMGGGRTSAYTADRDLAKRARKALSNKKLSANPLDWIAFVSDTVETGPRFATYRYLRQSGVDPQKAFFASTDITVNFKRGGTISRQINKVIPFFNANVQGLDKFARWITAKDVPKDERKKVIKSRVFAYIAVSAVLATIVYAINNGDEEKEEDYEQLSNYIKNSYWNIPLGDGKFFAIPKPREIGVLSSFFETCMEYGIGENKHAFDEFYEYATDNFLPSVFSDIAQVGQNGLVETGMGIVGSLGIIGVVGYLGANRDFLGKPIVSSGMQNLEPKDQYTSRTSKIAYSIGQAFNTSPMQIDYFFQQVLGGWWKYQKAIFPVGNENIDYTLGVYNTYVKDNQYSTDLVNWLYDKADASEKAKNSNSSIENRFVAKMDDDMTSFYSKYYKLAKDKPETTSARATRQLVLNMINEYRKVDDSGQLPQPLSAVKDVILATGNTNCLPGVMQTEIKDGNDKTYQLSAVQYVEYQTDYLRLYWEAVEELLPEAETNSEKINILLSAKDVAKEKAGMRTLSRIGASTTEFGQTYGDLSTEQLVEFYAGVKEANSDNSTTKSEVVDVIANMNLDSDDAWTLYFIRYSSKDAIDAKEKGIDGNFYMQVKTHLDSIEPDYNEAGNAINGSRRRKVENYLSTVCNTYEEYLFMLGTEYPSVKKDEDYIIYFGDQ